MTLKEEMTVLGNIGHCFLVLTSTQRFTTLTEQQSFVATFLTSSLCDQMLNDYGEQTPETFQCVSDHSCCLSLIIV